MREPRMVHLATASGFEARLLAARLGAEGVLWQLRGESSVYPMDAVDVLVDADDLDRARELLLVVEVDAAFAPSDEPAPGRWRGVWLAAVVVVLVALLALRAVLGA